MNGLEMGLYEVSTLRFFRISGISVIYHSLLKIKINYTVYSCVYQKIFGSVTSL